MLAPSSPPSKRGSEFDCGSEAPHSGRWHPLDVLHAQPQQGGSRCWCTMDLVRVQHAWSILSLQLDSDISPNRTKTQQRSLLNQPLYLSAPALTGRVGNSAGDRKPDPVPELSKSTLQTQFACPGPEQSLICCRTASTGWAVAVGVHLLAPSSIMQVLGLELSMPLLGFLYCEPLESS